MDKTQMLAFGAIVVALLLAISFAGCSQQKKDASANASATDKAVETTTPAAPSINSADVPSYDSSIDSELDNLSSSLG